MGGLFDVLMPGLYHGRPVLAFQTTKFDPELTFDLIPRLGVRNVFMPATALRMLAAHDGPALSLRTLASGGEMVGEETAAWCSERLGARLNEFYGQTEANLLIGNCEAWPAKPGSMGRAYPGHELRLVDGEIAVRVEDDPVTFLGYWRNEAATAEKVRDGWLHTGDLAEVDDDGYYRFVGRTDDLISSAGHRIGPGEIEECLVRHPSVTLAAVIGVPDELRGEAIKAFVVAASPSEELAAELKALVRERLAAYEVPREIEFVDELPLTTSGKIRRNELRSRPVTPRYAGGMSCGSQPSSSRAWLDPRTGAGSPRRRRRPPRTRPRRRGTARSARRSRAGSARRPAVGSDALRRRARSEDWRSAWRRSSLGADRGNPQAEDAQAVTLHVHPAERLPVGLRDAVQRIGPDLGRVVVAPLVVGVVDRRRSVQLVHADDVMRGREHHA